jgi:glycosyltransferase involved in cell wall biosynthesis
VRALLVSGIWPPDPGGPASHAPALAQFLQERGHGVEVVTTADAEPEPRGYPVYWVARSSPLRHLRVAALVRSRAARGDVVYATSMIRRAALGTTLARRPLVVKLVSDEAFERARRSGRFDGTLDEFQRAGGARNRFLRATRDASLRRARHVFCPSAYLRRLALEWGLDEARVSVLPNPAPDVPPLPSRETLRAELGLDGDALAFAGRLGPQKSLDVALEALVLVPGVTLAVAGDGPDRGALERRVRALGLDGRVRFLGSLSREGVLRLFRAADASILSSSWENFPHTVVEALAVGTPVLATTTGGVAEVVRDGENGLLVASGDVDGLAAAIRRSHHAAPGGARRGANAAPSVEQYAPERIFARLEQTLAAVAR